MSASLGEKSSGGGRRPGAEPPLLDIDALTVEIQGTRILDTVSLNIAPGEILALTGESGSGKSMTALATMGLLPQGARASGRIALDGTDLLTLPERRLCDIRGRDIGMVFQEPMTALNPVQSIGAQVSETILQHAPRTPRAKARAQAREALARCGLDLPLSRYPHELSGGQRQRVVIAMAIALRPRLLIADEPTTALDVTTQAQILDLLQDLPKTEGMALMMITHDLAVVSEMADRIARHQARRGPEWRTIGAPLDLAGALRDSDGEAPRLVDCLTLWLTNLMLSGRDWEAETRTLAALLPGLRAPVVFVTNEVGAGIVPENKLARDFRDAAGLVNQQIAAACDELWFCVAGHPMKVK